VNAPNDKLRNPETPLRRCTKKEKSKSECSQSFSDLGKKLKKEGDPNCSERDELIVKSEAGVNHTAQSHSISDLLYLEEGK